VVSNDDGHLRTSRRWAIRPICNFKKGYKSDRLSVPILIFYLRNKRNVAVRVCLSSRLSVEQVCVRLSASADNVTLLAFAAERRPCSNRPISAGRRAHSSKPTAAACGGRMVGRTDGQTDRRTLDSFVDPALHTMPAVSITRIKPICKNNVDLILQRYNFNHFITYQHPSIKIYDTTQRLCLICQMSMSHRYTYSVLLISNLLEIAFAWHTDTGVCQKHY